MDWISKSILLVLVGMVLLRIAGRKSISQMRLATISTKKTVPASSTTLLKQNTVCFFYPLICRSNLVLFLGINVYSDRLYPIHP